MENLNQKKWQADRLLFLGVLLFCFGLLIAFFIPMMNNSRMGLSAHLEGVINGMFLVLLGLIWHKLELNKRWLNITLSLSIFGSFANFTAVSIAAITGAGKMMPIAGGKEGSSMIEGIISFLLITLSFAMLIVCVLVLTGLYRYMKQASTSH